MDVHEQTWLAIFVGGASSRMGGAPKGLIPIAKTGESIVDRQLRLATELGLWPVFVGAAEPYALRWPNVRVIEDLPKGIGPLGGLSGVLHAAGDARVIALACDMPHVSAALLARLNTAEPDACLLAARSTDGRWDPLCARYDGVPLLPHVQTAIAVGIRSFQGLFARLTVSELVLDEDERQQLVDWDTPEDVTR